MTGLLDQARSAGLLADNPDYGKPLIADAMVTRVVIVTGGTRHQVLVSALGYPNPGLDATAMAARAKLSQFIDVLQHPERIAGVSAPQAYTPDQLAVFVLRAAGAAGDKARRRGHWRSRHRRRPDRLARRCGTVSGGHRR